MTLKHMTIRATIAAILCAATLTAHAVADTAKNINIPAGDLITALEAIAKQADVELLFRPEQLRGLQTKGLTGTMTPQEAVKKLLEGTTLQLRTDATNGAMMIGPTPTSSRTTDDRRQTSSSSRSSSSVDGKEAQKKSSFWDRFRLAQVDSGLSVDDSLSGGQRSDTPVKLEEVVVTAQKREERLQNVPISISVLNGDQLDSVRETGASEMLNRVPGLISFQGQSGNVVGVRGVTSFSGIYHGTSTTAFYLDSMPFALIKSGFVPDVPVYDLERIEVLRGPQGTLYGAGALNGVVRVLTKDADLSGYGLKARFSGSATDGGGDNYRGDLSANFPIIADKLAVRLTAGYQDLNGWIDRVDVSDNVIARNVNDQKITNLRLKMNAQATERLSIGLSAWHSRDEQEAHSFGFEADKSYMPFAQDGHTTEFDLFGARIAYDLDAVAIVGTTSYLPFESTDTDEFAGTGLPLFTENKSRIFTQEVYVNSKNDGVWRWSAGGMYRKGKDDLLQTISFLTFPIDFSDSSEAGAVFGEATRSILGGRLELTGGLRYFVDHVEQEQKVSLSGPGGPVAADSNRFDAWTPRVVLTLHPRDRVMAYASYSQGFRSGFGQNPLVLLAVPDLPAIKPDRLHNFELGSKGTLRDGALDFETAVYYIKWKDVIQDATILWNGASVAAVSNASSASGLGIDSSLLLHPSTGLALGMNLSWNDLRDDEQVVSAGLVTANKDDRLSSSPELTGGLSIDYVFPVMRAGTQLRLSGSANYSSKTFAYTATPGTALVAAGENVWSGRASVSLETPRNWVLTLFAENIGNEKKSIFPPVLGLSDRNHFAENRILRSRPRTIGLQLEYSFDQ